MNIVAIDGPTSSGKSTIGWLLSQKLGYQFIDSGLFYRLVALQLLRKKVSLDNQIKVDQICHQLNVEFVDKDNSQDVLLEGEVVTSLLHTPEVTALTPISSANANVRKITKQLQRKMAGKQNTVMTGRDIGSEIFPDAKYKFYITASAEVRAARRFNQLKKTRPGLTFEKVLEEIADRDLRDTTRAISPLRIPDEAIIVDTSNLDIEQTVNLLFEKINKLT